MIFFSLQIYGQYERIKSYGISETEHVGEQMLRIDYTDSSVEEFNLSSSSSIIESNCAGAEEIKFEKVTRTIKNRVVEVNSQLLELKTKLEKDFLGFAERLSFIDVSFDESL